MKLNFGIVLSMAALLISSSGKANNILINCSGTVLATATSAAQKITVAGGFSLHFVHYNFNGALQLGSDPSDKGIPLSASKIASNQNGDIDVTDSAVADNLEINLANDMVVGQELPKGQKTIEYENGASVRVLKLNGVFAPPVDGGQLACEVTLTKNGKDKAAGFFSGLGAGLLQTVVEVLTPGLAEQAR
jgi:hypothetical protein